MKLLCTRISSCIHCPFCKHDEYWDILYCSNLEGKYTVSKLHQGIEGRTRLDVEIDESVSFLPDCPLPDAEKGDEE